MINFSKHSLSLRREQFIRSIKQQQQQNIKAKFRYQMEHLVINPVTEVWRLKDALAQYNIHYYSKEILQIINCIRPYLHDLQFLRQLKCSRLLQDLFVLIIEQLKTKPYLQAPHLTQILIQLAAQLLKSTQFFVKTLEEHMSHLLFSVYKYPMNNKIVEKVTYCIAFLQPKMNRHQPFRENFKMLKLVQQQAVIIRLFEIYLLRQSYQTSCGSLEFVELSSKGDQRWFKNAVNTLQIINNLLISLCERQCVFKYFTVKKGISQGLKVFISKKRLTNPFVQEQSTSYQTFGDSLVHNQFEKELQQCISYFISVFLDIIMLRQQLIGNQQQALLRQVLSILLSQMKKSASSKITAAKIIKILYEQVILDESDLQQISSRYYQLYEFIQAIINNDCI